MISNTLKFPSPKRLVSCLAINLLDHLLSLFPVSPISTLIDLILHEFLILFLVLQTGDLANANASENDKILAMMQQSGETFRPDQ